MHLKHLLPAAISIFLGFSVNAHPTSFKDSVTLMANNTETMNDVMLAYSLRSDLALGVSYLGMEDSEFYVARVNYLAQRWNNFDSQGNIYVSGLVGTEVFEKTGKPVHGAELIMDWEDRRYYMSVDHLWIARDQKNNPALAEQDLHYTKARVGFAPFLGEFTELNVWMILQAEKYNSSEALALSQLFRFYYRNTLWEVGATFKGGFVFNYMIHF